MSQGQSDGTSIEMREIVRMRPGMYFGGTNLQALHHTIWTLVENVINLGISGKTTHLQLTLSEGTTISIRDDGPGIPVDIWKDSEKTVLEIICSEVGGKGYNPETEQFRGGMFGSGIAAVNAVSATMTVQVKRDGYLWRQTYREAIPQTPVEKIRPLELGESTGTVVTYTPDFTIFEENDWDYDILANRLHELAYIVNNLSITLEDQRPEPYSPRSDTFHFPDGLQTYVQYLNRDYEVLSTPITAKRALDFKPFSLYSNQKEAQIIIDFAIQFTEQPHPIVLSFVNSIETIAGGTHVEGLLTGVADALSEQANDKLIPYDIINMLSTVISIWYSDAEYKRPVKSMMYKLVNPEVHDEIYNVVCHRILEFAESNPEAMQRIVARCLEAKRLRDKRRYP